MYVYICMRIFLYECMYACVACACVLEHIYVYVCVHAYMYSCICEYMCACGCIRTYVCTYICMCTMFLLLNFAFDIVN